MATQQLPLHWEYWEEPSPILSLNPFPDLNLQQQQQHGNSIHRHPLSRRGMISSTTSQAPRSVSSGRPGRRSRNPSRSASTKRVRMRHDHLPPLVIPRRKSSQKTLLLQQIAQQQRVPCPVYKPKPIKPVTRNASPTRAPPARKRTAAEDSPITPFLAGKDTATTPFLVLAALPGPLNLDLPTFQDSPLEESPVGEEKIPMHPDSGVAMSILLSSPSKIVSSPADFSHQSIPDPKLTLPSRSRDSSPASKKRLKRSSAIYKNPRKNPFLSKQRSFLQHVESCSSYTSAVTDSDEIDWLPVQGVKEPEQELVEEFEEMKKDALRELIEFVDSVLGSPLDNSELVRKGLGETPKRGRSRRERTVWWKGVREGLS